MKIDSEDFRVREGRRLSLARRPTRVPPVYRSKAEYEAMMAAHIAEMSALQDVLYAANSYALLLIFQAMDAAGKDGAIKHVMSGINPQGCQVFSFKQPSAEELDHDFLWRCVCRLPERGRIGIFNRSYYEDVLIARVHPKILKAQRLPEELVNPKTVWRERYRSIVNLEEHLHRNGTRVVKFFLHLSKEEQRKRFLKRIEAPEKNWKFSMSDIQERHHWDDYTTAYEDCLGATSTRHSPWYVVPADDKESARLIVSRVVRDTLKALRLSFPKADPAHRKELVSIRKKLMKEA